MTKWDIYFRLTQVCRAMDIGAHGPEMMAFRVGLLTGELLADLERESMAEEGPRPDPTVKPTRIPRPGFEEPAPASSPGDPPG